MSTIQDLFQQAQLAEAAYADFSDPTKTTVDALTTGDSKFSTAQATAFVSKWRVVDQYTASGGLLGAGSGFSGTLFQNIQTGEYQFSLRGTEPGVTDLSADIGDIVADGLALDQIIDMYNYWQRLTNLGVYQAVVLETQGVETAKLELLWAQQTLPMGPSIYANYVAELQATGIVVDMGLLGPSARKIIFNSSTNVYTDSRQFGSNTLAGQIVNVDGHSLGGHLAMAFSRLFPGSTADVVAVNGAGFNFANGNVNTLFSALHGVPGFDAGKITNVVGSAAMNLVSQDWLFLQQPAGRNEIYTESADFGTTFGHGSSQMTDSLAVYNLFATLDPNLNTAPNGFATITNILKASSNVAENTLEAVISDLGKLFNVSGAAGFNANEFDSNRDLLYTALNDIAAALPANSSFTLRDLSAFSAAKIISNAQADTPEGLAYRYALTQLTPFTLLGADYSAHNSNGELDLYDFATRQGQLTDLYLKDRAAMFSWKMKYDSGARDDDGTTDDFFRTDDKPYSAKWDTNQIQGNWDFIDQGTSINGAPILLAIDGAGITQYDHQIVFGSNNVDTLLGSGDTDHLYGMGDNDILTGGVGKDYLEGGQGTDTYIWNSGDGLDTLLDSDGQGSIITNGRTLYGGKQQGANNTYTGVDSAGTLHNYIILSGDINSASGGTLLIDGTIEILNYRQNQLGITLNGATAPTDPTPTNTITGDISPTDFNPGTAGIQAARDAQGNLIGTAAPYEDILVGTAAADHILSGELADNVGGRAGNDWIEGGNGNDYVNGDEGDDLIEGGSGTDILAGDAGDDRIYGHTQIGTADAIDNGNTAPASGQRGDWLSGGAGADTLIAGADNDVLAGGGGDDILISGAGDDHILGDSDYTAQYILEATPRYSEGGTDWYHTSTAPFNWTITPENGTTTFAPVTGETNPPDSGNDVIYAGSGDDHVWAGAGSDIAFGEGGNDVILGEAGNDTLWSEAANDIEWRMQA